MSQTHDIDNDAPFYLELDSYGPLNGSHRLEGYVQEPQQPFPRSHDSSSTPTFPTRDPPLEDSLKQFPMPHAVRSTTLTLGELDDGVQGQSSSSSKGKGVSQPVDIQRKEPSDVQIDILPVVGSSSSSGNYDLSNAWPMPSSSSFVDPLHTPFVPCDDATIAADPLVEDVGEPSGFSGKGKGRERPPVLPPLVFMPTALEYGSPGWSFDMSPQTPGPSSYGSGFASIGSAQSNDVTPPVTPEGSALPEHVATRRRSLSSLSVRSTRSLSALSANKVKVKLTGSKTPGNVARKLLFRKRREDPSTDTVPNPTTTPTGIVDPDFPGRVELGRGSCFLPWAPPLKSCTSPPVGTLVDIDVDLSCGPINPLYRPGPPSHAAILRAKGRSYSSPFPLPTSPLDIVPVTPAEISEPVPIDIQDYFDDYLPHELKLHILASIVDLYAAEHLRNISSGKWTAILAGRSRNKWVGVEKGIRELLKLSRVSKAWQSLVYDGQLWTKLPKLPPSVLARLSESAGGFVRAIDFTGLADLTADGLMEITDSLSVDPNIPSGLSSTRITTLSLQGCTELTTLALHHLLVRSPALQTLCVKGLGAVINNTCAILSTYCPNIISLDASRCINLDGEGIRTMAMSALDRGEKLRLKVLRLNWLGRITDDMMHCLGRAAPDLEVLDLSYAAPLHNSAIEAFVSLTEDEAQYVESVQLTAREAGRDPADPNWYWKRVTRLRHLAFSSCILLTDHACSHLAHAVPRLEFLELAGIGEDLQDDGLVRLFNSTPFIRRVDLEDACEITDSVLAALTPRPDENANPTRPRRGAPPPPPQPGHALEHLVISHAANVTNEALLALVRNCTRLRVLEADNTRMNSAVMKEFVYLSRQRKLVDPCVAAIDCRGISEHAVKSVSAHTRPRRGWRAWEARGLKFLDGRDEENLGVGQDECDETRVVLKTFYSWQTVDAVRAAREKKKKTARRGGNGSASSAASEGDGAFASSRTRWWAPNGRRSGAVSPIHTIGPNPDQGCTIM